MIGHLTSWVLMAMLLASKLLVARRMAVGWVVGAVADALFAVYGMFTEEYGFVAGSTAFAVVRFYSWRKWRREDRTVSLTGASESVGE